MEEIIVECIGFDWDAGNIDKNWLKHDASPLECEQVFYNVPILYENVIKHSQKEERYFVLGVTDDKRALFIAFTIRNKLIRIISARDMSKKERKIYEQAKEEDTTI